MHINWVLLIAGCLFGLLPGYRLINSECRYCDFESLKRRVLERPESGRRRKRWWKLPLVWIDPIRGYIATMLILQAIEPADHATGLQVQFPGLLAHGLLFACVVVQTLGRGDNDESISPAGFVAGLMLAMLSPVVAIAALIVGLATAWAMSGYAAGYIAMVMITAGMGLVFEPGKIGLVAKVSVAAAPLLACWWRQARFVTPVRM